MTLTSHCIHGLPPGACATCGNWLNPAPATVPLVPMQIPSVAPVMGCICPPGANKECENPICPRKGWQPHPSAPKAA